MTSVVGVGIIHSCRTRRLRHAVAETAEGNTAKTAVPVAARRTAVVTRYTVVTRRTVATVTTAGTARARLIAVVTTWLTTATDHVSRQDISARITAHTLPSTVPVAAKAAHVTRSVGRIYRCEAAVAAVTSINTRITNVTHSISISFLCI